MKAFGQLLDNGDILKTCCWAGFFFPLLRGNSRLPKFHEGKSFSILPQCNTVIQTSQREGAICGEDTWGDGLLLDFNDPVRHCEIKQVMNCHNYVVFSSRAGHIMKKMETHFLFVILIKYFCQKLNRKFTHQNSWPIFHVPIVYCSFFSSFWTPHLSWMRLSSHLKKSQEYVPFAASTWKSFI